MKRKFGAKKQPKVPKVTLRTPNNSSFLWLNLTLKAPSRNQKMTEATAEMVTNWLAVAIETGSEEPKNVNVMSIRNMPVRASIIHVEK
jgi:hypothetical protein